MLCIYLGHPKCAAETQRLKKKKKSEMRRLLLLSTIQRKWIETASLSLSPFFQTKSFICYQFSISSLSLSPIVSFCFFQTKAFISNQLSISLFSWFSPERKAMSWLRSAVVRVMEAGGKNNLTRTVKNYAGNVANAVAESSKILQDRMVISLSIPSISSFYVLISTCCL